MDPMKTIEVARLAVDTRVFPLYEIEDGDLMITRSGKGKPVSEYLSIQGRFRHLTEQDVAEIQAEVDARYAGLEARVAKKVTVVEA